jgi:hypothetical protein
MNPRDLGRPELRIGDEEREAAVSALGEHYAAGRLTKEEYDERAARAFEARTHSQLLPLFADLPRPAAAPGAGRTTGRTTGRVPGPDARRGHPGWWAGTWMVPVLAIVVGLVILTHLPLFLLIVVAWLVLARMGRHWARGHGHHQGGYRSYRRGQWVR